MMVGVREAARDVFSQEQSLVLRLFAIEKPRALYVL